jgi:integrase
MGRQKSTERYKLTRFKNRNGTYSWRVSGPATEPGGKRVRQNFRKKPDAIDIKADLERKRAGFEKKEWALRKTSLTEEELATATSVIGELEGESLGTAVGHYKRIQTLSEKYKADPEDLIKFVETHFQKELEEITIWNAYERFLKDCKGRNVRDKTYTSYKSHLKPLISRLDPNAYVHEIKIKHLEEILAAYEKPTTRNTHKTAFSVFFNWATARQYVLNNPAAKLGKIHQDDKRVHILSLEETRRLLKAAMTYRDGYLTIPIAIGLFAGLRPSELEGLTQDDIYENDGKPQSDHLSNWSIHVKEGKNSRKESRLVPVPKVLKTWLEAFPFHSLPTNRSRPWKALREATNAENWVQDVIRHTSISYQLARDKNEALVAYNNGTSKKMMKNHYRRLIRSLKDVQEFWAITPESLGDIEVKLPRSRKRIQWPADDELLAMIKKTSNSAVARKFDASEAAVRKRVAKIRNAKE